MLLFLVTGSRCIHNELFAKQSLDGAAESLGYVYAESEVRRPKESIEDRLSDGTSVKWIRTLYSQDDVYNPETSSAKERQMWPTFHGDLIPCGKEDVLTEEKRWALTMALDEAFELPQQRLFARPLKRGVTLFGHHSPFLPPVCPLQQRRHHGRQGCGLLSTRCRGAGGRR